MSLSLLTECPSPPVYLYVSLQVMEVDTGN